MLPVKFLGLLVLFSIAFLPSTAAVPTEEDSPCQYALDPGPCSKSVKRYAFDWEYGQCIEFKYTGCGGTPNRFGTMEDCDKACPPMKPMRVNRRRSLPLPVFYDQRYFF